MSRCLELDSGELNEIVPKEGNVYSTAIHLSPIPTPSLVAAHVHTGTSKFAILLDNLLIWDECQTLIDQGERLGFQSLAHLYEPTYRNNTRIQIQDPLWCAGLMGRIWPYLPSRIERKDGVWVLAGRCNPCLRLCKYTKGGIFKPHRDADYQESSTCKSFLTVNIYLNDVSKQDGGATSFLQVDDKNGTLIKTDSVQPRAGSALIFDHSLLHQGDKFYGSEKYLCRTDVMYEKIFL